MKPTKPFPYQAKGVRKIHHFDGRALLADEMGLGKTLQALLYAREMPDARPIVVVCPASLKWNWEREARLHVGMQCHILEGRTVRNFKQVHPIVVINYDILGPWLDTLKNLRPQVIIIDECHKIGSSATKQTKNTKQLCRGVPHVICLSGTPLVNRPAELWSALSILRPDVFTSKTAFEERYCHRELKPWGWQAKGAENLDELHRLLNRTCMIRRLKSDVISELPAKSRHIVPLDINNRNEYEAAVRDFIGWLTKKSASLARKARKAEKLAKIGYLKRLAAQLKLSSVLAWVDDYLEETDEKIILFGVHRSILTAIHERYAKQSVLIDGSVVGKERQNRIDQFNRDSRTRVFIGNIKAAGVGWSCTSSSVVGFVEFGWTPGDHTQAEDRVHGIKRGQHGIRSRAYYLVARDTIESHLCEIIQRKQSVLDGTLDGGSVEESLNIFDQLERLISKPQLRRT